MKNAIINNILIYFVLGMTNSNAQTAVHFESEREASIGISADSHEELGKLWIAPAELGTLAGKPTKFYVISIFPASRNVLWWYIQHRSTQSATDPITEVKKQYHCAVDEGAVRCFNAVPGDILVPESGVKKGIGCEFRTDLAGLPLQIFMVTLTSLLVRLRSGCVDRLEMWKSPLATGV